MRLPLLLLLVASVAFAQVGKHNDDDYPPDPNDDDAQLTTEMPPTDFWGGMDDDKNGEVSIKEVCDSSCAVRSS